MEMQSKAVTHIMGQIQDVERRVYDDVATRHHELWDAVEARIADRNREKEQRVMPEAPPSYRSDAS